MELMRLQVTDNTWTQLEFDWTAQCQQIGDDPENYAPSSMAIIRSMASTDTPDEWAVALKSGERFMAIASAVRTVQKGFTGKVLRIREVTVCPLLDYGNLSENDYVDTLIGLLNGAVKLSESSLRAKNLNMHLRSPADAVFFRAVGNTLDSQGVFEETATHGAWLSFVKHSPVRGV